MTAANSILRQSLPAIELIAVDDNSDDETLALLNDLRSADPRVRVVVLKDGDDQRLDKFGRNVNAGWKARNVGLDHARGRYITFQDSDDWSVLNRLELQLKLLTELDLVHLTTSVFHPVYSRPGLHLDISRFVAHGGDFRPSVKPEEISRQARSCLGLGASVFPESLFSAIPFQAKFFRPVRNFFYAQFDPFPGGANNAMFHAWVKESVQFRPVNMRKWPSERGRGADRDFAFNVALRFGASAHVDVPLYAWDTPTRPPSRWDIPGLFSEENPSGHRFLTH